MPRPQPRSTARLSAAATSAVLALLALGLTVAFDAGTASAQPAPTATTAAPLTPTTEAPAATDAPAPTTEAPATTTATTAPTTTPTTDQPAPTSDQPAPTSTPTTTATTAPAGGRARPTLPEVAPEGVDPEVWELARTGLRRRQACGADPGRVCQQVLDWTGNRTLAEAAQWAIDVPLRIVLVVLAALVLNKFVRRFIRRNLDRVAARSKEAAAADPSNVQRTALRVATVSSILGSAATAVIGTIAVLVSLSELGIDLGPMLAGAGIAGIAIGFGAQNLVRDILAGLFVMIEDQYGVGDIVDVGKASGVVEEFSLRVTKIRDVEGTLWFVPNGVITEVGNKSQLWARAILDIEVAYRSDHAKAARIIKEAADRLWAEQRPGARIIEEPELWGVERLGESGVAIRLAVKSAPAEQFTVARALRGEIKEALDASGIEIPFPQRTIWVRSADGSVSGSGDSATGADGAAAPPA